MEVNALKSIIKKIKSELTDNSDKESVEIVKESFVIMLNGCFNLAKDGTFKHFRHGFKPSQLDSNFNTIYNAIKSKYATSDKVKSIVEGYMFS